MVIKMDLENFYKGKKVLVTGHTGFKGSWLIVWLSKMGAKVIGYALDPKEDEDLFNKIKHKLKIIDIRGDIRDKKKLEAVFDEHKPEIVFHLAAQPIVKESYDFPHYTFETNIMGSANLMECVKNSPFVKSCLVITTDKVYKNKEVLHGYTEEDELGGQDPYSASKSCVEIVVNSYNKSFFGSSTTNIATARSGNVIGGGDNSKHRIIPDCVRMLKSNKKIIVRNPASIRPWLLVLETLYGYLLLAQRLHEDKKYSGSWNYGPEKNLVLNVESLVNLFIEKWGSGEWTHIKDKDKKEETVLLTLDIKKTKKGLGWTPSLNIDETVDFIVDWYKESDSYDACSKQIDLYCKKRRQHEKA